MTHLRSFCTMNGVLNILSSLGKYWYWKDEVSENAGRGEKGEREWVVYGYANYLKREVLYRLANDNRMAGEKR